MIRKYERLDERELKEKAQSMLNFLIDSRPGYMFNHWSGIYARLHPRHSDPDGEARKVCMIALNKALSYHLENTISASERLKIIQAITELKAYS